MSEMPSGEEEGQRAGTPSEPEPAAGPAPAAEPAPAGEPLPAGELLPPPSRRARSRRQAVAWWLATLLAAVVAGVAAVPFWAPAIMPLMPWGRRPAPPPPAYAALMARLDAIEQRPDAAAAALARLQSEEAALGRRLDQLDAALAQRGAAAGALQDDVARLDKLVIRLGDRIGALEASDARQASADGRNAALLLSLIELREAVAAGRPFTAEYQGFAALAQGRSELEAEAAPLAPSAAGGIASRAALQRGLSDVAGRVATTAAPAPREWWQQALARIRGLVIVRRIGVPSSASEAAVAAAEKALDDGNLTGAVGALAAVSGPDIEATRPWLQQARARLAAEAALARLQDLLTARLGAAPAAVPRAAPAGHAPTPAKPGAPS
jgi:hypothetical protein